MSESVLALVHAEGDALGKSSLEAVGAAADLAAALGAPFAVGIVGRDSAAAANAVASCGAARFLGVSGPDVSEARYASDAAAFEAIARASGATLVLLPGTSRAQRVAAGLAHRLGGRSDSHATAVAAEGGAASITRWFYRQRMEATLARTHRPWVIALDPGCRAPWTGAPGAAALEPVAVPLGDAHRRTRVEGIVAPSADEQTIRPDAEVLLVAGAGWTKKQADGKTHVPEAEKIIRGFLRIAKASLGGSKSVVDLGEGEAALKFMTHLNQVGQTGSTPRHPKGLATCCHGEEPHVVGWRFITERRAISLDAGCGWAQGKADVLYVADAFAVMARVNDLLGA